MMTHCTTVVFFIPLAFNYLNKRTLFYKMLSCTQKYVIEHITLSNGSILLSTQVFLFSSWLHCDYILLSDINLKELQ